MRHRKFGSPYSPGSSPNSLISPLSPASARRWAVRVANCRGARRLLQQGQDILEELPVQVPLGALAGQQLDHGLDDLRLRFQFLRNSRACPAPPGAAAPRPGPPWGRPLRP